MSIVVINALTVPEDARGTLEERFAQRKHAVDSVPGFEGFKLLRPTGGEDRYFVYTQWASKQDYENWRDGDARIAHAAPNGEKPTPAATNSQVLEFEIVEL